MGRVALTDDCGLSLNKLIAIRVELQADCAPHVSRVDLNLLASLYVLAMAHSQVVGPLHALFNFQRCLGADIHDSNAARTGEKGALLHTFRHHIQQSHTEQQDMHSIVQGSLACV